MRPMCAGNSRDIVRIICSAYLSQDLLNNFVRQVLSIVSYLLRVDPSAHRISREVCSSCTCVSRKTCSSYFAISAHRISRKILFITFLERIHRVSRKIVHHPCFIFLFFVIFHISRRSRTSKASMEQNAITAVALSLIHI